MSSIAYQLDTPAAQLNGVGPVVARGLERLGIQTIGDLLNYYPYRWEDYSRLSTIAALRPGLVSLRAKVEQVRLSRTARRRVPVVEAVLSDETGTTKAIWFGQSYLANQLKEGQTYFFSGEFAFKAANLGLQQPNFETIDDELPAAGKIVPVYHENKVINSKLLSRLISQVIDAVELVPPILPDNIRQRARLLEKSAAIAQLHQPASTQSLDQAKRSLAFEELFVVMATGLSIRRELAEQKACPIPFDKIHNDKFLAQLPYKLTDAQRVAAWQVFEDMKQPRPMHRLLQGDVGSGKTVVALMAAMQASASGGQTAFLVPTEILARQHLQTAQKLLKTLGVKSQLLVAGMPKDEQTQARAAIADGTAAIVIGTHSLIQDSVDFADLRLAVVDEQHRFGVAQRDQLLRKNAIMPHLLAMTATPIPRSLTHVLYGDMDISIIDELPPGRQPVETKLFLEIERANAYAQIDSQIAAGRQVYIICPRIEQGDESGVKSVQAEYERLQRTVFMHRRISMLHGRLKSSDKERIMADFVEHKADILITTSVIEVGVDIPNASVMMIEDADHFGLAALHQLRGRVGRGQHQSYCYLFSGNDNPAIQNRLRALERTSDGFRLAQIDLETRGPGEIFGTRQHGRGLDLRLASLTDSKLLAAVRQAAKSFVEQDDLAKYPALATVVSSLKQVTVLD